MWLWPIKLPVYEALCRMCSRVGGYVGIGLQSRLIHPRQISCNQPRYPAKRHYIFHITERFPGYQR